VRLVNAETLNVVREVSVKESDLNINYSVSSANLAAWNAITTEQKVTRLNEVIDGAIGDAVTKLLKPERRRQPVRRLWLDTNALAKFLLC
jgi:curli biogenesis system outer membrane secretion channel CsgG